jgi:hypothetical protein
MVATVLRQGPGRQGAIRPLSSASGRHSSRCWSRGNCAMSVVASRNLVTGGRKDPDITLAVHAGKVHFAETPGEHDRHRPTGRNADGAGWRLVCLLRASPLKPFVATSYWACRRSARWITCSELWPRFLRCSAMCRSAGLRDGLSASTGAALPAVAHIGALVAKVAGGGPTPPA